MTPLIVFGAGGHAREIAQVAHDINDAQPGTWQLIGFVADSEALALNAKPLPAPLLGNIHHALTAHPSACCVIAVGDARARRRIAAQLLQQYPDLGFATLVHPRAWLAERVIVGQGSVVFAGAHINVDVTLGVHNSINLGCSISHDCVLGDHVNLGPGVHLSGAVKVGDDTDIGAGATLRPGISLGAGVVIGAGAAVVHDVASGCAAVGVPARSMRR